MPSELYFMFTLELDLSLNADQAGLGRLVCGVLNSFTLKQQYVSFINNMWCSLINHNVSDSDLYLFYSFEPVRL